MPPLNTKTKLGYSLGQLSWAAKDTAFHYFLFFYYTQFAGLSASLAGLAALLALIADAISDPIIGQVSDNWRGRKWGRRHPFMALAIIPFPVFMIAIFNPPAELTQNQLFAWYLFNAIALRTFLTLFTVPHLALGAELSNDYEERTSIATFRNLVGYAGGLSIQVIAWFILIPTATAAGAVAMGYRNVGFVAAGVAVIGMLIALWSTLSRIPLLPETSAAQKSRPWYYAFSDVLAMLRHHSPRTYLGANMLLVTAMGVSNTMLLHINQLFYGFSAEQTGVFMLCIFLCLLPAALLASYMARRFDKERAVILIICCMSVLAPVPVMAHLYGLTPPSGSSGLLLFVCIFIVMHQSLYIAQLNIAGGMVPDIADELALNTGRRQEAMINSGLMLAQKMIFGLGAFIAGLAISYAGVEGISDASQMTESMKARLAWVYGPGLMCLSLLVALIYSRYRLSRSRVEEIRRELDKF